VKQETQETKARVSGLCPRFHKAVELIGRRWTGALLQMLMGGRRRYSDLKAAIPEISDRMLSERLRELESEGILRRIVTPETPVRVEYELTEKGCELHEPLRAIGVWAEEWIPLPAKAVEEPRSPDATTGDRRSPAPRR
jgi:DNA-binding HxlR family transcriptional regulator